MGKPGSLSIPGWESTRGENHRTAKLTDDRVRKIREMAKTKTRKEIAAELGIPYSTISDVVARRKWGHVQ